MVAQDMIRGRRRFSLRWLLAMLLAGLMTLLVSSVAFIVGEEGVARVRAAIGARLEIRASLVASRLDDHLRARWRFISFVAEGPVLGRAETLDAMKRANLQRIRLFLSDLAVFAIVADDGTVTIGQPDGIEGRRIPGLPGDGLSRPIALADGMATPGLPVPTLIHRFSRSDEPAQTYLMAQLDWALMAAAGDVVQGHSDAEDGIDVIVVADTVILESVDGGVSRTGEDAAALLRLGPNATMIDWRHGRHLAVRAALRGGTGLPAMPVSVVVLQDVEHAFATVYELRKRIIAVGVGFVALAALAGWLLAGWIAGPIDAIAHRATELDGTGSPAALPRSSRYVEVALLGEALTDMLQRIEEQAARLAAAFETSFDGIVVTDDVGTVMAFNAAAERMFGYPAAEVVGRNVTLLMPDAQASGHDGYMRRYLEAGEHRMIGVGRIARGRRRDGGTFPCQLNLGESRQADGRRVFTGFIRDLSSQREVETRLRTAQDEIMQMSRMITIGQVGGQLAHELNQPLGAIANYAQAVRRALASGDGARARAEDLLDKLGGQVTRASGIVRRLRRFVGGSMAARAPEDVNDLIEQSLVLAIVGPKSHRVRVETRLASGLPPVTVDRTQIQQVLTNLIRNAVEAMSKSTPAILEVRSRVAEDGVEIEIADRGPGIDPAIAERLFSPFVTTKPGGLGLGLSICRSIVETHGGRIAARPNSPGGTVFTIWLPFNGPRDGDA